MYIYTECKNLVFVKSYFFFLDLQPPQFTFCPKSFQTFANKDGFAKVSWEKPIAKDNSDNADPCGSTSSVKIIQEEGNPSGSIFKPGHQTVKYSAIDGSGNTANCTFTVIVEGR